MKDVAEPVSCSVASTEAFINASIDHRAGGSNRLGMAAQEAFEQYRQFFRQRQASYAEVRSDGSAGFDVALKGRTACYRMASPAQQGWTDLHVFGNGLMVGRMQGHVSAQSGDGCREFPDNVRLSILLEGNRQLQGAGGRVLAAGVGDIVVRHGDPGPLSNRMADAGELASICIDVPREMLDMLRDEGHDLAFLGPSSTCRVLRTCTGFSEYILAAGRRMLSLRAGESALARLELESLGLDFLVRLMSACAPQGSVTEKNAESRWAAACDRAIDIVHAEWNQQLTIAALARRAGINECYLKNLFLQKTGQTVASYVRGLRMQHARDLMASGRYSVQQVAWQCGYAHAGKFAQAFRAAHGVAPSELR